MKMGHAYFNRGEYEEALREYKECRKITEASLGKNHPQYATTLNNIGSIYINMGKYEEALR